MALAVKKDTTLAVETESPEGTYVPASAATSYVQTLSDGLEVSPSKEQLERNIGNGSLGKSSPLTGQRQVSLTIPVECKANSTAGGVPEFDKLIKSAMGSVRSISTTTTTKSSGNTATVLCIEDADISKFTVGDIIMVKQSGAYHVSPITSKSSGVGTATITMLVAHPSGDCTDSVVIEKSTNYVVADSGHPSLSITKHVADAVREYSVGCKVTSFSLENFSTGQMPTITFSLEGLNYTRDLSALPHTPTYSAALPPIVLDGRFYMDGTALTINEFGLNVENSLGFESSIAATNGRVSSRVTERVITGTINPYKLSDSIANYTKYDLSTAFSLFAYAKVPTSTAGQFGQVVAVYLPNCTITELTEADQDGLLQDSISFSANRGVAGSTDEIVISFI